jgi:hypothetical protein
MDRTTTVRRGVGSREQVYRSFRELALATRQQHRQLGLERPPQAPRPAQPPPAGQG